MYFIYNGVHSDDLGIVVNRMFVDVMPQKRINQLTLPHYEGTIYQEEDTHETFPIEIECTVKQNFNHDTILSIKNAFKQRQGELVSSRKPNHIYKVALLNRVDFTRLIATAGTFKLTFEAQPLSFLISGQSYVAVSHGQVLVNRGNYRAFPKYKVTPSSENCQLNINGQLMSFECATKPFIVDCELEDVYGAEDLENLNYFMKIESDFIGLSEGENVIEFAGISQLEIQPNWREV